MKKLFLLYIWTAGYMLSAQGQAPITVTLDRNPALQHVLHTQKDASLPDTVELPFIDDFWYYARSPYPDPKLWIDRHVFINNNFPIQPRSNGVATFDALDANGQIYDVNTSAFYADTLTSAPVNLSGGPANVYLSFFYQPQGRGDAPETGDSLILQFKNPDGAWRNAWQTHGVAVHLFNPVIVQVDGDYLYKGFQFRFVNIISFNKEKFNTGKLGNVDMWHIDYVLLDKNRNVRDTVMADVAVIEPTPSMIKGYRSIPWKQFTEAAYASQMQPRITITYRNNDNSAYYITRVFEVTDVYHPSQPVQIGNIGGENIDAGAITTHSEEVLNPFVSVSVDSALFEFKSYLLTNEYDRKENDTVCFYQEFKNYFARDDGVPESGYGFEGSTNVSGSSIACRYETFVYDTIRAVGLYFNPVLNNVTSAYRFRIAVWKDNNGTPGEQAYLSEQEYSPEATGEFIIYPLEKPVAVTKYYWIGWQQVTVGFLNVGFDLNHNDKGNLWYNTGYWHQDMNNGTLMIRPYVGRQIFDLPTTAPQPEKSITEWKIYPNPAATYLNIETGDTPLSDYTVEIFSITGQLRYRGILTDNRVNVNGLEQGMYVLRLIRKKTGHVQNLRFIINR
ncbi:MAG: T9SS type A sorting domain-containing protein [Bacteroidales bacterium]|jgi:hypothetical protein|nr:T9SS type A sorting domain-containing protein [Bacteroidales bacterium]